VSHDSKQPQDAVRDAPEPASSTEPSAASKTNGNRLPAKQVIEQSPSDLRGLVQTLLQDFRGTVQTVSSRSISIRSADGTTYDIKADGYAPVEFHGERHPLSTLRVGDVVQVKLFDNESSPVRIELMRRADR
jgi:hypothetical protein